MDTLFERFKQEFFAVLPPTIFFFVALHLIAIVRVLAASGSEFRPIWTVSITVAALILGKGVLIADHLPGINRYPEKPLVYNVVWKTFIYLLLGTFIHYMERLVHFSVEAGGIVAGNEQLIAQIVWPHFWAIEIVLFLLIFMYCTTRELVRVIGRERALRIFFGPLPLPTFEGDGGDRALAPDRGINAPYS
jgi:hypothetical protein